MKQGVHISRETGYTQAEIIALIRNEIDSKVQAELQRRNDINYPVGYIWMSAVDTDPGTIVGGTWTRIQDTFLLAAGTTYTAGDTGGEATHTLTIDEMPSHSHTYWDSPRTYNERDTSQNAIICVNDHESSNGINYSVDASGGSQAHNNMPPYLTVYMWQRTA